MEIRLTHDEFAEALERDELLGLRCRACGTKHTPPTVACRECGSTDLEPIRLSGNGKIVSYTAIYTPPAGFEGPYIVALVELEEGPWVMGNLLGLEPQQITDLSLMGKRVSLTHLVREGDAFSSGKMVAMAFHLE